MNLRTRLALSLIVSSLPAKTIDASRVHRLQERITKLIQFIPSDGKIDVREVLLAVIENAE